MSSAKAAGTRAGAASTLTPAQIEPEFWSSIGGHEYAIPAPRVVSSQWVAEVRAAAARAWTIYAKIAQAAAFLETPTLLEMGFPRETCAALSQRILDLPNVFGRFDAIETPHGFRVIEFNAETPFFWLETYRMNGVACRPLGLRDPNAGCEAAAIAAMRRIGASLPAGAHVAVTASNVYREDFWTATYLAALWSEAIGENVTVAPVHELRTTASGLYHGDMRIELLHRCYPLEHVAADRGGPAFFDLLRAGAFAMVNPGASLLLQNKMTQALIWGLYERGEVFDARERRIVEETFLPTYADEPEKGEWVRKPVLGREGSSIAIVADGVERASTPGRHYRSQPMVYQQYVAAPQVRFALTGGSRHEGRAVATCAVVAGQPSAIGMRIGAEITDAWAYFQPLAIE